MATSGLFASPGNHGDLQINSKAAKKEKIEKRVIISSILQITNLFFQYIEIIGHQVNQRFAQAKKFMEQQLRLARSQYCKWGGPAEKNTLKKVREINWK